MRYQAKPCVLCRKKPQLSGQNAAGTSWACWNGATKPPDMIINKLQDQFDRVGKTPASVESRKKKRIAAIIVRFCANRRIFLPLD